MIRFLRQRLRDMRTLSQLCTAAERCARQSGQARPGSEHFLLAALGLPDGSAARVFGMLGVSAQAFAQALASQRLQALAAVGVALPGTAPADADAAVPLPPAAPLYEAQPSGAALLQRLAAARHARRQRGLAGADVLLAVADETHSTAARALRTLGIDPARLRDAAAAALQPTA